MSVEAIALALIFVLLALIGARQEALHAELRNILKELQDEEFREVMKSRRKE